MTLNRSLQARTRPEFYDAWATMARKAGVSEKQITDYISDSIREANEMVAGRCPKCGAPLARYVNYEQQQGPSNMPGAWVMYRCSTAPPPGQLRGRACDFMLDLKEGEAAN